MADPPNRKAGPEKEPSVPKPATKPSTPAAGVERVTPRRPRAERAPGAAGPQPAAEPRRQPRSVPPRGPGRQQGRTALDRVRDVDFPLAFRGYDRGAVDQHLQEISQLVAELEARQLRESVVQRALDEVGEQTATIMRRAHEAADEISARSKSQAEGRIQRAEREADAIRGEAQEEADRLRADTLRLWAERQQLIEEIRHLADETLGVADVAMERLAEPPRMGPREVPPAVAEEPTAVVDEPLATEPPAASEEAASGERDSDTPA